MKAIKRILATMMSLCLVLSCVFMTAFAEGEEKTYAGSITIQNQSGTNATVAGKTFNLFKIFSATTDGTNVSYDWCKDDNGKTFEDFFKQGEYNYLAAPGSTIYDVVEELSKFKSSSFELSQFAAAIHDYVHNEENEEYKIQPVATIKADDDATSVTFTELGLGYYMIYDATQFPDDTAAVRSAAMLTTNKQNVTISLKANRPSIVKEVQENNGTFGKGTSSSIGDTATFKISTHIPSHTLYGEYHYYIEDTMPDGFSLKDDTIKVYRKSTDEGSDEELAKDEFYALSFPEEGDTDFKIDFTDYLDEYNTNDEVYVIYDAVITDKIKPQEANVNTAKLTYSNDPTKVDSYGSSVDLANVYSYQFVFTKFAQDENGRLLNKRLKGAEFQLYRIDDNGTPNTTEDDTETLVKFTETIVPATNDFNAYTKYIVADTTQSGTFVDTLVTHNDGDETITIQGNNYGGHLGDISIFGLAEGKYKMVETKAPDGYNLPVEPFVIEITDEIDGYGFVGSLTATGSHSGNANILNVRGTAEAVLTVWAEITNKPGATLPETGGVGTTLFTVIGITLMAGALAFFTSRKRSSTT